MKKWVIKSALIIAAASIAQYAAAQHVEELPAGSDRVEISPHWGDPDYEPIHRSSHLLNRPEIREVYEEYLERRDDPGFREKSLLEVQDYDIGDTKAFYVINFEESQGGPDDYDEITFELSGQNDRIRLWVEQDELGEDQVSESVISGMMEVLTDQTPAGSIDPERGLYDINKELFGDYPNVDGTGILNILITDVQEARDEEERNLITLGFFNPRDLNPTASNSNAADIIYLNSNPFIYGGNFGPSNWHSTLSHEIQHLIHGNYGGLNLFQNEGQSEMSEILTGYRPRPMNFLSQPEERTGMVASRQSQGLFRWRSGQNEVLQDYERAGLLHTYLAERISGETAGSITRGSGGVAAYQDVMEDEGLEWEDVLIDFHVANLINREYDGHSEFRYTLHPSLANLRARNFSRVYNAARSRFVTNREVELQFGGVKYTRWIDVSELELELESGRGIHHKVWYRTDSDSSPQLESLQGGTHNFSGEISEMTLISVNTDPGANEENPTPRTFTYSGEWNVGETLVEELNYAVNDEQLAFFDLPSESLNTNLAVQRISPTLNGEIKGISFRIRRGEEAIVGDGNLIVGFTESQDDDPFPVPANPNNPIDEVEVDFNDLGEGMNTIDLEDHNWAVDRDTDYFITYRVEQQSDDAGLQLLADSGRDDDNDELPSNYYTPPRTLILTGQGTSASWRSFSDSNNLSMVTEIHGVDPDHDPQFREPPVSEDRFELKQNYPNPFNPVTNISYSLHMEIDVSLEVYDVTGRKITTLVDERQEEGLYTIEFDPSNYNLATGMYLYRFRAGSFSETKKMMFVK